MFENLVSTFDSRLEKFVERLYVSFHLDSCYGERYKFKSNIIYLFPPIEWDNIIIGCICKTNWYGKRKIIRIIYKGDYINPNLPIKYQEKIFLDI